MRKDIKGVNRRNSDFIGGFYHRLAEFCYSYQEILFSYSQRLLSYLAFEASDVVQTWWRVFGKHVVRTKLDIYVFVMLVD